MNLDLSWILVVQRGVERSPAAARPTGTGHDDRLVPEARKVTGERDRTLHARATDGREVVAEEENAPHEIATWSSANRRTIRAGAPTATA